MNKIQRCQICFEEIQNCDYHKIYSCSKCNGSVHIRCFHANINASFIDPCIQCKAAQKEFLQSYNTCQICPNIEGLMFQGIDYKQKRQNTKEYQYYHFLCYLYQDSDTQSININKCNLCKKTLKNSFLFCSDKQCNRIFHPKCGTLDLGINNHKFFEWDSEEDYKFQCQFHQTNLPDKLIKKFRRYHKTYFKSTKNLDEISQFQQMCYLTKEQQNDQPELKNMINRQNVKFFLRHIKDNN